MASPHDEHLAAIAELIDLKASGADTSTVRARQFAFGLAWPTFPVGLGGRGVDAQVGRAIERELGEAGLTPPTGFVGPHLVAPVLVDHGTPVQHALLQPIFTEEHLWCQLFSEPSAGSDLANVSTRAVRDGASWVVRGQKVWNSFAHEATHGILLTRSDADVPKHRGITMFLLDMRSHGVTVRPLRDMTGHAHFNEVFFDDVLIDDECRLGPTHEGWGIALEVLRHERMAIGRTIDTSATARRSPLERLEREGCGIPPSLRSRFVGAWIKERVIRYTLARMMAEARSGKTSIGEVMIRVLAAEHNFSSLNLVIDSRGAEGMLHPIGYEDRPGDGASEEDVHRAFLYSRGLMIGGGTVEISRNQIAERQLGLPPEPRIDKDRPWREVSGVALGGGAV